MINLKKDCIFISDAHYSRSNKKLYNILRKEDASMIIFMGDIFELLLGGINKSIEDNEDLIYLINELSFKKEIIYLEGNHDFNLKNIFPNIKVYPIEKQPVIAYYQDKQLALSHGDKNISFSYDLYTKIIRNENILCVISFVNTILGNKILNTVKESKEHKNKCYKIDNFKSIAQDRIKYYEQEYIIEGHFHQDKKYKIGNQIYINLPALACSKDIKTIEDLIK